jgi:hypothetical protein
LPGTPDDLGGSGAGENPNSGLRPAIGDRQSKTAKITLVTSAKRRLFSARFAR